MQFLVCSMVRWLLVAQILSLAASGFPTDFPANGGVSIPLVPHIKRSIPEQGQILSSNDSWTSKWHALPFIQSKSLKTFHRFHPESWQAFPENNDDWVVDWQSTLKRTEHKGTVPLITIPQDVGYLARIQIGSQKQPFTVILDTGSADLWIPSTDCHLPSCARHIRFNPSNSMTSASTGVPFKIKYGSGTIAGFVFKDSVDIAGFHIPEQAIGTVVEQSDTFADEPFDGILGLGFNDLSTYTAKTILDHLKEQGSIKRKIFSLFLDHIDGKPSELLIGAVNPARYHGRVTRFPIANNKGYWSLLLSGVSVGLQKNNANKTTLTFAQNEAIFDSGTSLIIAPKGAAQRIHALIPGSRKSYSLRNMYTFPCDNVQNLKIGFVFSGRPFYLSAEDVVMGTLDGGRTCVSSIQDSKDSEWILGGSFLRSVYSVFDVDRRAIGLARIKK